MNVCIFSYDEIYEAFNSLSASSPYDVLRLDVTWLSWFAEKLLRPLTQIEPGIGDCLSDFLTGTPENYAVTHGEIYNPSLHPQRADAVLPEGSLREPHLPQDVF